MASPPVCGGKWSATWSTLISRGSTYSVRRTDLPASERSYGLLSTRGDRVNGVVKYFSDVVLGHDEILDHQEIES
jgi:hypothetical protein